jgi:uncharacterized protein with PQ loop repeat
MFDAIMTFLKGSVEWQEFRENGFWSFTIISSIGILILTVFEMYGVTMQGLAIWRKRSGEAVSVTLFNFNGSAFVAWGLYGYYVNGAVAALNGILTGVVHLMVIVLLCVHKPLKWWEIAVIALCPLMIPAMVMTAGTPWQSTIYIAIALGIGVAMATQPLEMWLKKETGAVEIRMYLVYVLTTLVWLAYTISLGDTPFIIGTCISAAVVAVTVLVWCYYRLREPHPPQLLVALTSFGRKAPS